MKQIAIYYNATDRAQYGGERRNDFELFKAMLQPHLPDTEFVLVDSVAGDFPEDPRVFNGVILGGSAAMVDDDEPWIKKLLEHILILDQSKIKMLGICFGHQAIAKALGGQVEARDVTLGSRHLEILAPQSWMHPYMPSLRLYAGNFQQVTKIPESMKRIAMGRGNPNAMLVKDHHILSLQFHPEFPARFMEGYIDKCLQDHVIDAHKHQEARAEISGGNDSEIMAKWIAHFFADKPHLVAV